MKKSDICRSIQQKSNCPPPKKKSPIRKFDCWMMCLFRCPQTCWNQKNAGHITAVQHGSLQKMSFMEHEIPSQTLQISSFFRGKNPLIFQELDPHLDPPCGSQQSIQQKKRNFSTKKWNKRINVYIQNSSSGGVCLFWLCFVYLFG